MADPAPPEDTPKRRRRWKRWVLGFFALLVVFLAWANGPGLRWALKKAIRQQLEAQQLVGTFEVRGTALSGISLHEVSLHGPGPIQSVESDLLRVTWSLSSLLDQKVESLTLKRLHLVIDPAAPAPEPDEEASTEENAPTPLGETLDLIRPYVQATEIALRDLRVEVVGVTEVSLASLNHDSGSSEYRLTDLAGRDHLERPLFNPATVLTWTADGFTADEITLRPTLALKDLVFRPGEQARLDLVIDGRQLRLTSDLKTAHQLRLLSPSLPLAPLVELARPGLPLSGLITTLEFDSATGKVDLALRDLLYEDQKIEQASLSARSPSLLSPMGAPVTLSLAIDNRLTLDGTITPAAEILDSTADLSFELAWPDFPRAQGEIAYDAREVRLLADALDALRLTARFQVDTQTYQAEALSRLKEAATLHPMLSGPLAFTARARGSLAEKRHSGTLDLEELNLRQPDLPEARSRGVISWDWPRRVSVETLVMDSPEGRLETSLTWRDERLDIAKLDLVDRETVLLSATASIPAPLDLRTLDDFLALDSPLSLDLSSRPLSFETLSSFAPLPPNLRGVLQADLSLTGTPAEPALDGFASLDDFRLSSQPDLPPLALAVNFQTTGETLALIAKAREPGGPLLDLRGRLPFRPRAWIQRNTDPVEAPVSLTASTPDLDLRRLQPFAPFITSIDGSLNFDLAVSGTLAEPDISGSSTIRIAKMRVDQSPVSDFQDSTISASFSDRRITFRPSPINASGGKATLSGSIDLATGKPVFDLALKGEYFLLYRTPDFTFRGHPDLRLTGPFSSALLSGELKLVESLIYKDIEILPFGVSRTTEIPEPNLPSFAAVPAPPQAVESSRPGGVMDWRLQIAVSTADPILIRGNLAKGEIIGSARVFGTLGNPKTDGKLTSRDLVADLPFSNLEVQTGVITLRPASLSNPLINLRGTSKIGQYVVQVYLSGPVQNPKLVLTSDPPMPESEILLLLATGSASDQLADQQLASQKALQYLFEVLRRRNRGKDKSVLQRFLKNSDQIELSLGDTNRFSGRRFSSATLELSERWDFTTQIDEQGQTRALVIFSVRLR